MNVPNAISFGRLLILTPLFVVLLLVFHNPLAALITLIPLIVLIVAAVLTDRLNARAGGQSTQLTYRAYGA